MSYYYCIYTVIYSVINISMIWQIFLLSFISFQMFTWWMFANIIIFKSNNFGIIIANPAWLWESWETNYMCRSIMPKYHLTVSANLFFFCFQVALSTDLFDRVLPFSFLEVVLFLSCAFECPALLLWITCTFSCNFFSQFALFLFRICIFFPALLLVLIKLPFSELLPFSF